jgi:hypothetical protein
METSDLAALAGNVVIAAATTEIWPAAQEQVALLFGRGNADRAAWDRLDATHRKLHAASADDAAQVRAVQAGQWSTRLDDLLSEHAEAEPELQTLITEILSRLPSELMLPSQPALPLPAQPVSKPKSWFDFLANVTPYLVLGSGLLFAIGFACIGFYVASSPGAVLPYLGVGWLAACAAYGMGGLAGLVVGIPKFISSGALRHDIETGQVLRGPAGATSAGSGAAGAQDQVSRFAPSSNLAEISDWLTKLLLGAGLVELTRLGHPLGQLIDSVAGGLGSATSSADPARVVAATILFTYLALGFLDAYVVTTLWYGKHLQQLGYR